MTTAIYLGNTISGKRKPEEEVNPIPLIIRSPGKPSGISSSIVELVDLFPTACELTSLPIPDSVEGISLVPVLAKQDVQIKQSALSFVPNGTSLAQKNGAT